MGRQGAGKRNRERARQERQQEKALKSAERKRAKADAAPVEEGVDPDIAGIVPGPQPVYED
jgi:hypothetical protein